jgi:hypothetical protein
MHLAKSRPIAVVFIADGSHFARERLTAFTPWHLEPCGFFEFKSHDELIPHWEAHGDPDVATWDMGRDSKPRAVAD